MNSKKCVKARFRVFVMFTYLVCGNLDGLSHFSDKLGNKYENQDGIAYCLTIRGAFWNEDAA